MTKSSKLKAVAAVAGACAALFAAAPASAYVYAVSQLQIKDLDVGVVLHGTSIDVSAATNYTFNLKNVADYTPIGASSLNALGTSACSGNALAATTTCNAGAGGTLNATVANAPGLTSARAENNFGIIGSGPLLSYSNADSQITTAKLVNGGTTNTIQIAESLLNVNGNASANTEVKSTTTLLTTFVTSTTTDLTLSFQALLNLSGSINDMLGGFYTSSAGSNVSISLTKNNSGGQSWTWSPSGLAGQGCQGLIGTSTCTINANDGNLNLTDSVSSTPDAFDDSFVGGFKNFGLTIADLVAGTYSLSLQATTTTNVDRLYVPEPGSVALVGLALAGLGFTTSRRSRKQ